MTNNALSYERNLPVYLLLDTSGSMVGEPIAAMEMGIRGLLEDLTNDPHAMETVKLSVITFDSTAEQLIPLMDLGEFAPPNLMASGSTALGAALELLVERLDKEVCKQSAHQKGDWKPLVFVFTDGNPTDDWEEAVTAFHGRHQATVIACGAGLEVQDSVLKKLGDKVLHLKDTQPGTLGAFMKWVTASVTIASRTVGTNTVIENQLPGLPEDVGIMLIA